MDESLISIAVFFIVFVGGSFLTYKYLRDKNTKKPLKEKLEGPVDILSFIIAFIYFWFISGYVGLIFNMLLGLNPLIMMAVTAIIVFGLSRVIIQKLMFEFFKTSAT